MSGKAIKKVTVIGAGTMGKQIALNCAIHGIETNLTDSFTEALEKAGAWSNEYLDGRVAKGKMTSEKVEGIKKIFHLVNSLEEAVKDTDLVIEAIIENLDVKKELFAKLDQITPSHTILASNSSTYVPSALAVATKRPDKVANVHYFNPAVHMQLVEVIKSPESSTETIETLMEFAKATGKVPILVRKEIDGFIVNNILGGITKTAWFLVENGYATPQDIDLGAEKGLGHPMGPFRTLDLAGLDTIYSIRKARYELTGNEEERPPKMLEELVKQGHLGKKTGKGFYDYN